LNSDWMMPEDIFTWIEANIGQGESVLEFGSGHGSITLSKRYNLFSVEHNQEWIGISDSTYIHAEIEENPVSTKNNQQGWYKQSPVREVIKTNNIVLFLIDGPPGDIGRHGILSLLDILPKSAFFIVDDVHRSAELDLFNKLLEWHGGEGIIHTSKYDSGKERRWGVLQP
tara:strand:+ start:222 stop:731 length:510 start_codon:yes stop_codon:yes gene_type:complete